VGNPQQMRRKVGAQAWCGLRVGMAVLGCAVLANCSASDKLARVDPRYGVAASPRVVEPGEPVPKGGGTYRIGRPYLVGGRMYVPEENKNYRAEGLASWYGEDFHGRLTANGEVFDMGSLSAAHPTLPMPCYVRVTNLENRKSLIVRVNDRGPYHANREIDVSVKAAQLLGFHKNGVAHVRVEYVAPAPLEGSDDRRLIATLRDGQPAPAPSTIMVASTRPFLPRGTEAPLPPERPFDLGLTGDEPPAATSSASGRAQITPASLPGVAYADPRPGRREAANRMPAVAATSSPTALGYAPNASVGVQAATSGRGLY